MIILNNSIGYVMDVDASKVIEAIRATGVQPTHAMRHYAHTICSGLKGTGMWQNSIALYGMLGGTADSHKFNWKDLRDLDVANRLTFPNGMTHNSNGITGNGTNQYANTFLSPSATLSLNNQGYDLYIKDNLQSINNSLIGSDQSGGLSSPIINTNTTTILAVRVSSNTPSLTVTTSDKTGFYSFQRTSSTNVELYYKDVKYSNSVTSTALVTPAIYLMAYNADGTPLNFSTATIKFTSIRSSLTAQQAITSSQVITNAQSILSRA